MQGGRGAKRGKQVGPGIEVTGCAARHSVTLGAIKQRRPAGVAVSIVGMYAEGMLRLSWVHWVAWAHLGWAKVRARGDLGWAEPKEGLREFEI